MPFPPNAVAVVFLPPYCEDVLLVRLSSKAAQGVLPLPSTLHDAVIGAPSYLRLQWQLYAAQDSQHLAGPDSGHHDVLPPP